MIARALRADCFRRRARLVSFVVAILMAIATNACRSHEQMLTEHQKAVTSLRATIMALGEAWLSGDVPSRYVRTALETTQQLLEKDRAALTRSPDLLADPKAASLSESENQLARSVALLWKAVDEEDRAAVRQHLSTVALHADVP